MEVLRIVVGGVCYVDILTIIVAIAILRRLLLFSVVGDFDCLLMRYMLVHHKRLSVGEVWQRRQGLRLFCAVVAILVQILLVIDGLALRGLIGALFHELIEFRFRIDHRFVDVLAVAEATHELRHGHFGLGQPAVLRQLLTDAFMFGGRLQRTQIDLALAVFARDPTHHFDESGRTLAGFLNELRDVGVLGGQRSRRCVCVARRPVRHL
mmetsp:Transcript_55708/g.92712  ORF Transcript_55708/g.92712 Transcript_55708/m.92712 type:complete len:209 (+) Transcript_55708:1787-2413(+)